MPAFSHQQQAFISTLSGATGLNPGVVAAWVAAEEPVGASAGYHGLQNWLNVGITDSGPRGAGNPAWRDPVQAAHMTAAWMKGAALPGFGTPAPGIRRILSTVGQSPAAQIAAIRGSGWASGGYPSLGSLYQMYAPQAPRAATGTAGIRPMQATPQGSPFGASGGLKTTQSVTGGQVDWGSVMRAVGLREAARPIDPSGKLHTPNLLSELANAAGSGKFTTPVTVTNTTKPVGGAPQIGAMPSPSGASGGDINPIDRKDGWIYGRTDQGVDASAPHNAPIRAINDSRVVDIQHNWYQGQPLVLFQLTAGPNKGKYWYASEQIMHNLKVGDSVRRGQPVAYFAPSGTGIEIGWGHPGGGDTLAQAQGNTGGPGHSNAPAGINFRQTILHA